VRAHPTLVRIYDPNVVGAFKKAININPNLKLLAISIRRLAMEILVEE